MADVINQGFSCPEGLMFSKIDGHIPVQIVVAPRFKPGMGKIENTPEIWLLGENAVAV